MPTTYTWLTLTSAIQQIQNRLNDPTVYWSTAELVRYLQEGLRILNALTEPWKTTFQFTVQGAQWVNLGTFAGSPRFRTLTDSDICTNMEYMLLEPPVGLAAWTGTTQFSVTKLQSALLVRRNEVIQHAGCNTANFAPLPLTPNTRRTLVPDTCLEMRRIRFMQLILNTTGAYANNSTTITMASTTGLYSGLVIQGLGIAAGTVIAGISGSVLTLSLPTVSAQTNDIIKVFQPFYLKRSDLQAFHYFNVDYVQTQGFPTEWSEASEPPLAFDVNYTPNTEGYYDMLGLQTTATLPPSPPTAPPFTPLGVPDDWSWLPMYGALADVLSEEPESTDRQRAEYCRKRYLDGLDMIRKSNWFTQASTTSVACDTPSLENKDRWQTGDPGQPGWQEDVNATPSIVTDGIDQFNVTPCTIVAVSMEVIQNAPLLDTTATYVQVARDDWDQVLNYVQHIACFKYGGQDFASTAGLLDEFFQYCQRRNKRTATYGLYVDVLNKQGIKQDLALPR